MTSNQSANSLTIAQAGQVNVGPGAVLAISANTTLTGGTLNVDPNGAVSVGRHGNCDGGGSVVGGNITVKRLSIRRRHGWCRKSPRNGRTRGCRRHCHDFWSE